MTSPASSKARRLSVQIPPDLAARVEEARSRASVGSARPSQAAMLRAIIEAGLTALPGIAGQPQGRAVAA